VNIDRIRRARDAVGEFGARNHVVFGQNVIAHDAPRFAHADLRGNRRNVSALETVDFPHEPIGQNADLTPSFNFGFAQIEAVRAIELRDAARVDVTFVSANAGKKQQTVARNVQNCGVASPFGEITGNAGIYSSNLDDTKTTTGERYRNSKLSAANNNLDLNTWVRVTNLRNNKTVILRINDRMRPEMDEKDRVVYLSRAAAKKLGFIQNAPTEVKVEVVAKGTRE